MGAGFIQRFTTDPTLAQIEFVEGVIIIDRDPPASIQGVGTSLVVLVAEFEDGPFNAITQLASGTDLVTTFGSFGFSYGGGLQGSNPCARARKSDFAIVPEYWNGNGYIATWGKVFGGLAVVRVDTSVGSVQFTSQAFLLGGVDFSWTLTSGQFLNITAGATTASATFTGVSALITSGSGTYPSTFAGGEKIVFSIEGTVYTVQFLASDQSQAQVIARMNLAAGYPAFAVGSSTHTTFSGLVAGLAGQIQVVSLDALVATATGFVAGSVVDGTGNVPNIRAVQVADANTVVSGAVSGTLVDRDASGAIRLTNTDTSGTSTLEVNISSTALAFGFPIGVQVGAAPSANGTIPAGTRVWDSGAHEWVTMQTLAITAGNAGPYAVKVRPGQDDGSVGSAAGSAVNVVPFAIPGGAWSVVNVLALSAALSEGAIDAAYVAAIQTTQSMKSVAKQTNVIVSARQSNLIRTTLKSNAINSSAGGCYGRTTCIRPPLGTTTRATATSTTAAPGVGAYRSDRVDYCFPGANVQVPYIAAWGTAGGAGFTATGNVDVGTDTWLACVLSNLAPEQNPGQLTDLLGNLLDVEAGNPDVQNLMIGDYGAFEAAGVVAVRFDDGDVIFQSGVTSVDPAVNFNLKNIARRRMADFIEDSLAPVLNVYVKQVMSPTLQGSIVGAIDGFLVGLKSPNNPAASRISGYVLDAKTLNTQATLDAGIFKIQIRVKTYPSMDEIVLDTQVGETVDISDPTTPTSIPLAA
jgi:hypothetical protein